MKQRYQARMLLVCVVALGLGACTTMQDMEIGQGVSVKATEKPKTKEEKEKELQNNVETLANGVAALLERMSTIETHIRVQGALAPTPEPITIERPIFRPADESVEKKEGAEVVIAADAEGKKTATNYSGGIVEYDYNESWYYEIYCQPLRVTDIYLEPGETIIDTPYLGDNVRWLQGVGVSKKNGEAIAHVYLKPTQAGLETTLTINTDRRVYHLIIMSFEKVSMMAVRFRYPRNELPQLNELAAALVRQKTTVTQEAQNTPGVTADPASGWSGVDPRLLSTDYRMEYPVKKPTWLPRMVLDDGKKTYVVYPDTIIYHEMPGVFGPNGEIVNYRTRQNVVEIDRLFEKFEIRYNGVKVVITKKVSKTSEEASK